MDDATRSGGSQVARASARARITMLATTTAKVAANELKKGDVVATARVAAGQAARRAVSLLPLARSVVPENVVVNFTIADTHVDIDASVSSREVVGVEMAAMTAVTVAALTIYDMCKAIDRTMSIGEVTLVDKATR